MPQKGRKKSVALPSLLLLALLGASGGGAWYMMQGGTIPLLNLSLSDFIQTPQPSPVAASAPSPALRKEKVPEVPEEKASPADDEAPSPAAPRLPEENAILPQQTEESGLPDVPQQKNAEAEKAEEKNEVTTAPALYQASGELPADLRSPAQAKPEQTKDRTDKGISRPAQPEGYHPDNIVQPPQGVRELTLVTEVPPSLQEKLTAQNLDTIPVYRTDFSDREPYPDGLPSSTLSMDEPSGTPALSGGNTDTIVTPRFITGLARWMSNSYRPAADGGRGRLAVPLTSASAVFGQSLEGLRHITASPDGARAFVLYHMWSPGMLEALCRMYEDSFVRAMHLNADQRGDLDARQKAEMFRLYADQFRRVSFSFHALRELPDFDTALNALNSAERDRNAAQQELSRLVRECEAASREGRHDDAERLRVRMQDISRRIHKVQSSIAAQQTALIQEIRAHARGSTLNDRSLLYLAQWLGRRDRRESATSAARMLDRMALRFDTEAQIYR